MFVKIVVVVCAFAAAASEPIAALQLQSRVSPKKTSTPAASILGLLRSAVTSSLLLGNTDAAGRPPRPFVPPFVRELQSKPKDWEDHLNADARRCDDGTAPLWDSRDARLLGIHFGGYGLGAESRSESWDYFLQKPIDLSEVADGVAPGKMIFPEPVGKVDGSDASAGTNVDQHLQTVMEVDEEEPAGSTSTGVNPGWMHI
jgi:hypothetical protein